MVSNVYGEREYTYVQRNFVCFSQIQKKKKMRVAVAINRNPSTLLERILGAITIY